MLKHLMLSAALVMSLGTARPLDAAEACAAPDLDAEGCFDRSCSFCHRDVTRLMAPYVDLAPEEARAELDRFLTRHHPPEAEMRAALIDWLLMPEDQASE